MKLYFFTVLYAFKVGDLILCKMTLTHTVSRCLGDLDRILDINTKDIYFF